MVFLHYAQNISKAFSTSFIFLTCKISRWELNELIMSFFKFSKRLTIYVRVTPKPATYFVNLETSLELIPFFALTLEYLLHNSHILSYFNWCKSLDPIKFNNSKDSYWISLSMIVLTISLPNCALLVYWWLYWKCSM